MVLNSLFWCFEVQCESSSYRSPKEAPATITFGLPDVHPSQNQTEGQALCVDSCQLVDGRVPGVVEPTCERRFCRSRNGTCSEWLYCRLGDDPSLSGSCDYIDSHISTGVLQYWYHFLSLCPCFSSVKLCYQVTASLSFGTCVMLGFGGQIPMALVKYMAELFSKNMGGNYGISRSTSPVVSGGQTRLPSLARG